MTPLAKLLAAAKAYREAAERGEKLSNAAYELLAAARDPGLDEFGLPTEPCRECGADWDICNNCGRSRWDWDR